MNQKFKAYCTQIFSQKGELLIKYRHTNHLSGHNMCGIKRAGSTLHWGPDWTVRLNEYTVYTCCAGSDHATFYVFF